MNEELNHKIIAIGGTGQISLHYYLQLYLLGVVKPFDAVVIDSDDVSPSIRMAQRFFDLLRYSDQPEFAAGGEKIPLIETIKVRAPRGNTAFEALTGRTARTSSNPDVAEAFFDRETLDQNVQQGLFARPALSAVIDPQVFQNAAIKPKANSNVVLVSSLIGGTGGGLTAPVLDALTVFVRRQDIQNITTRAVFFGEYFKPREGVIREDVSRFQSNQALVLRSIREAKVSDKLRRFSIVGGPGFEPKIDRQPEREREPMSLPWPEREDHPYWLGLKSLQYFLIDAALDVNPDFAQRETHPPPERLKLQAADLRLRQGLNAANTFVRRKAILRMCRDPWARVIWGTRLVELVAHFWNIAARKEGGLDATAAFPRMLQDSLMDLWNGEKDAMGLRSVFPPDLSPGPAVRPRTIARMRWPQFEGGRWDTTLFTDASTIAKRAGANILFRLLREGF